MALVVQPHETGIAEPEAQRVSTMSRWTSTLIALAGFLVVLGIAFGEMAGIGQLIHTLNPHKHFDVYYALHNHWVLGSLIAVSVLWLLPPHPWANRLVLGDRST